MNTSRPKRWLLWIVAVPAVGLVAVLLLGRPRFGAADLLDQLDPVLLRVERRFTREHTEPTSKAAPFLEVDLHSAVQALLAMAETSGLTPYSEIPRADWPAEVQRLNPVAVTYFDSQRNPDGNGVILVIERRGDRNAGILICRQRNPEWQGAHFIGHVVRGGPDFGFRRLHGDGEFWHWYRSTSTPAGSATQPTGANRPVEDAEGQALPLDAPLLPRRE